MEELKDDYNLGDLDNFIIKDNEYKKKKRMKCFLITTPIILVIIAIVIAIVLLSLYKGGTLTCTYITLQDNESVKLLNDNIYKKYTIKIKSGEKNIDKTNTYIFSKAGKHELTIKFKEKIDNLENFFEDVDKLYEVDLSQLIFEEDKINSVKRLFKNCVNLKNININININTKL